MGGEFFLSKELVQMIEERIPYGRFLTSLALLLGVLAIIVVSCVFLFHAVVLPVISFVVTLVTTGKISLAGFGKFLFSLAVPAIFYFVLEWLHRGSSRLMREVIDNSKGIVEKNTQVLAVAEETNRHMAQLAVMIERLEARVSALEES